MKAVIMAGGKGTRLRPLTCNLPKPMVPILTRPVMEHIVRLLASHGFDEIFVTLHYLPEVIQNYFGDGTDFSVKMTYFVEDAPLGTAGSVKNVQAHLDETFLVISGDALTDINLAEAVAYHRAKGAVATLLLVRVATPLEYGVVITESDGRISRFLEKPSWGEVFSDTVNTGIYVLEPEVVERIPEGREFDFSKNLFPALLAEGAPLFGYVTQGYWCDIGTLDQYQKTHYDILSSAVRVLLPGKEVSSGIWVGEGAQIHPDAKLVPPLLIGDFVKVGGGASLGGFSVLGRGVTVESGASIVRAILWDNVYVGENAELDGAMVCGASCVKSGSRLHEGAVVGARCSVGERSVIKPGVKVWPDKVIDSGTILSSSLIWGRRVSKRLFGTYGVSGLANIEVGPEFAGRLGAAYGSCLPEGSAVAVSSDIHRPSRMIRRALVAGILSSGVNVYELGHVTTPVTRYGIAVLGVGGGVHVRISPYDPKMVLIEFLDERGINIDKGMERKIENAFFSEDFRRAGVGGVGEVAFLTKVAERYLEGLLRAIEVEAVRSRRFRVAVSYHPGTMSLILPSFLDKLGCEVIGITGETRSGTDGATGAILDTIEELSRLVAASRCDLGILVDDNAEKLILIDENGVTLSDDAFLFLISMLTFRSREGATVAVPVTASRMIEDVAKAYNGRVIRTKTSPRSMMELAIEEKVFAGARGLPQFQPVFDALLALGKLLEFMARESVRLSRLVAMMPRSYMSRKSLSCPWEAKGRVMRTLIEATRGENVELLDGIKVYHDKGWALILPDSEEPLVHIYSEASTLEDAEALRELYMSKINEFLS